ncbi:hypothetical protein BSU04_01830 [Caballeronia sordidicola]|uniref:Uncharacterized protein n=1 Tax=Caballeronia sordidicola TaxID=196367 RepID=A0A226XAF3_CABSO|nr:hypothetical protein BSU04_01830 [Caballeronia sordidicola]
MIEACRARASVTLDALETPTARSLNTANEMRVRALPTFRHSAY